VTANPIPEIRTASYKVWFDLGLLALAHLFLLPLWLLLWISIPLLIWIGDRGPVFYKQERTGKNGKVFTLLKFRTMVPGADRTGPAWTVHDDPRVTRAGRLLRRTALDELPGLISILKREMSFVGPRALATEEHQRLEQQVPGFAERLQVLPGLTGLAQVYDLTDDAQEKFRYDLEYLQRMGPWLDIKLLTLSVANTLGRRWDRRGGKPEGAGEHSASKEADAQRPETASGGPTNPGTKS
jgi:lipopolysaccharide/colanic/teichoic acid biosynthesis glycosyltransferase